MNHRPHALVTAMLTGAMAIAPAAEAPVPDSDFLEFLGSLDIEDEEWRDYLAERPTDASRPVEKAPQDGTARKPAPGPAPVPTTSPQPAAKAEQVRKP